MRRLAHRAAATTCLAACLMTWPAITAEGAIRDPSARDLWRAYPLDPSDADHRSQRPAAVDMQNQPGAVAAGDVTSRAPDAAPREPQRAPEARDRGTAPWAIAGVVAAVAAALGVTLLLVRRPRGQRTLAEDASDSRQLDAGYQTHGDGNAIEPVALAEDLGWQPATGPPDAHISWEAEIEWRRTRQNESRFCLSAIGVQEGDVSELGESAAFQWPPAKPADVEAIAAAHAEFEASIIAAGWAPVSSEGPWYAKRFAWTPGPEASPREVSAAESNHPERARADRGPRDAKPANGRHIRSARHAGTR